MTGKNDQPTNQNKVPQLSGQSGDSMNSQGKKVPHAGKEVPISKDATPNKGASLHKDVSHNKNLPSNMDLPTHRFTE